MSTRKNVLANKKEKTSAWVHVFFILFGIVCIIPFVIIISASLSSETDLAMYGFSVLPKKVDFTAYKYLFKNPEMIINSYIVTILSTVYVDGGILPGKKYI